MTHVRDVRHACCRNTSQARCSFPLSPLFFVFHFLSCTHTCARAFSFSSLSLAFLVFLLFCALVLNMRMNVHAFEQATQQTRKVTQPQPKHAWLCYWWDAGMLASNFAITSLPFAALRVRVPPPCCSSAVCKIFCRHSTASATPYKRAACRMFPTRLSSAPACGSVLVRTACDPIALTHARAHAHMHAPALDGSEEQRA